MRMVGTIPVVLCEMMVPRESLGTESKKKEKEVNLWRNGSQSTDVLSGSAQEGNVTEFKEEKNPVSRMNS